MSDNVFRAAATLGASVLGTGVLAMPHAVTSTGIIAFVLLSLAAVLAANETAVLLVKSTLALFHNEDEREESISYAQVVGRVMGSRAERATAMAMVIQQVGSCVAYVVVIGDVFAPLIRYWTSEDGIPAWGPRFGLVLIVVLPLALCTRDIGALKLTSAMAVGAICVFCLTVIGNGFVVLEDPDSRREQLMGSDVVKDLKGPFWGLHGGFDFFRAIPVVVFAYFMHFNVLQVLSGIRRAASTAPETVEKTYQIASILSFGLAMSVTVLVGVLGYWTFLSETKPDLLRNFPVSGTYVSSIMNVVRALYGVGLLLAFPVVLWEARSNALALYFNNNNSNNNSSMGSQVSTTTRSETEHPLLFDNEAPVVHDNNNEIDGIPSEEEEEMLHRRAFFVATLLLVGLTVIIGCVVTDLGLVFGFIGSTVTPALGYVIPCLVYLKSGASNHNSTLHLWLARFLLCVGIGLVPLGLGVWVTDMM